MTRGPRRIICLTPETADILYRLGAGEQIVGTSRFTRFPRGASPAPIVSTFTTFDYGLIVNLKPDLILGFSDLQAEAAHTLIRRGYAVLITNQRTLSDLLATVALIGSVMGRAVEAEALAAGLELQLLAARQAAERPGRRPRVYFEEWGRPLITGIAWVGELIAAAGGEDIFPELHGRRTAPERVVEPEEVAKRAPDIIVASWCGKKAKLEAIRARPGWESVPAVRNGEVHEVKSDLCLQPGPILIDEGLPRFRAILDAWRARQV